MGRISTEVKTAKLQWKEHWTKAQKQEVWCNLGGKKKQWARELKYRMKRTGRHIDGMP